MDTTAASNESEHMLIIREELYIIEECESLMADMQAFELIII